MEITKKNLVLTFGTTGKTQEAITVTNPKITLEGSQIKTAMDKMLASGAIGEQMPASSIVGAKYIIQQVDEVELA